jgi:hypothetical protein
MENLNGELLAGKQGIAHELLSSNNEINHHYR